MKFVTAAQMRRLDERAINRYGIPGIVLMENAAIACAHQILKLRLKKPRRVLVLCGKGNNGGDGFAIARHLANRGLDVKVYFFQHEKQMKKDAATNYRILKKMEVPRVRYTEKNGQTLLRSDLNKARLVVDAIFGTGLSKLVGDPYRAVIAAVNASKVRVLSVDVPSGMNADTGEPMGICIRADKTVTFAFPKRGFAQRRSRRYTGQVCVRDISIPAPS